MKVKVKQRTKLRNRRQYLDPVTEAQVVAAAEAAGVEVYVFIRQAIEEKLDRSLREERAGRSTGGG